MLVLASSVHVHITGEGWQSGFLMAVKITDEIYMLLFLFR